jgi:HPt (histidine-containing phosphotransfer) domain-containing protein
VTEDARQAAADAGADMTLPKPVQPIRLLECVSSLCDQATPQEPERVVNEGVQRPSARETALLNLETVKQLATLGSGPEFLSRLATTFEAENRKLLDQVDAAVRSKRFVEIPSILHALKGSAGSLGLDHLAHVCGQYQSHKDGELRFKGEEVARQLRTAFNEGCAALQGHIEMLKIQDSARGS